MKNFIEITENNRTFLINTRNIISICGGDKNVQIWCLDEEAPFNFEISISKVKTLINSANNK